MATLQAEWAPPGSKNRYVATRGKNFAILPFARLRRWPFRWGFEGNFLGRRGRSPRPCARAMSPGSSPRGRSPDDGDAVRAPMMPLLVPAGAGPLFPPLPRPSTIARARPPCRLRRNFNATAVAGFSGLSGCNLPWPLPRRNGLHLGPKTGLQKPGAQFCVPALLPSLQSSPAGLDLSSSHSRPC